MMTLLEESYRWWLRLMPAWYRRDREEEMVATFIEAAGSGEDAEIARPSWAEIRGVLALAVRTRLGGAGAVPRARARGEGVRVFALGAFHQDAAPVPRTGPLVALPAGAILIGLWTRLGGPDAPAWLGIPDLPAIYCWLLLAATAGYAIMRRVTGRLRAPGWTLGLALLAVPVLAARVLGLAVHLGQQPGSPPGWLHTPATIAAVQDVMVGLTTLVLLIAAVRTLRRLPASAPAASPGPGAALPG